MKTLINHLLIINFVWFSTKRSWLSNWDHLSNLFVKVQCVRRGPVSSSYQQYFIIIIWDFLFLKRNGLVHGGGGSGSVVSPLKPPLLAAHPLLTHMTSYHHRISSYISYHLRSLKPPPLTHVTIAPHSWRWHYDWGVLSFQENKCFGPIFLSGGFSECFPRKDNPARVDLSWAIYLLLVPHRKSFSLSFPPVRLSPTKHSTGGTSVVQL